MGTLSNISFPQIKKTSHINKCTCTYDRKKKKRLQRKITTSLVQICAGKGGARQPLDGIAQ